MLYSSINVHSRVLYRFLPRALAGCSSFQGFKNRPDSFIYLFNVVASEEVGYE